MKVLRSRIGLYLRRLADRIDDEGAPHAAGASFTIEPGIGLFFRLDGRGCPLWYLGNGEYERAHAEADRAHLRVDWINGTASTVGGKASLS